MNKEYTTLKSKSFLEELLIVYLLRNKTNSYETKVNDRRAIRE